MRSRPLALLGGITAALLLVGCTTTTDDASPSAAPDSPSASASGGAPTGAAPSASAPATPGASPSASGPGGSPTPAVADIDRVELDAEEFRLWAGSALVSSVSLDDTGAAVAALTPVLGEPEVVEHPEEVCSAPWTTYEWGDALLLNDREQDLYTEFDAFIREPAHTTGDGRRISLEGPAGISVGGELVTMIGETPDTLKQSWDNEGRTDWVVILQQGFAGEGEVGMVGLDGGIAAAGVGASTEGTTVSTIISPMVVHSSRDC
jgi:hypothetical protein